jgi:two-component system response regulator
MQDHVLNTILIAEDDMEDQEIITSAFKSVKGTYNLVFAANGQLALDELIRLSDNKRPPLLIILDMNMPIKDGLTTLKEIRDTFQYQDIPVVMYSNSGSPSLIKSCQTHGCTDYVIKPFVYEEIISDVEKMLTYCNKIA